ncbi:hypothetical protein TIFTF001_002836 [Ficus carica]|uniref:Uncharacterized protein n=1 Tax=Ficus carica TaxID=3494 RepID=A0AA87ZCR7_FICCA|nr:hypothetical protein TIFTF001_002836 [Ficus carica]
MGRSPCCDHETSGLKKGPWTPEEDKTLVDYIATNGHGCWRSLPKLAGLNRCGKSCRLRWTNYLRPDIKRGKFSEEEERIIIDLHSVLGNKWSKIATHLPGRTDNEIKNFWNTYLRKKLLERGIDPNTHKPRTDLNHLLNLSQLLSSANYNLNYLNDIISNNNTTPWENALIFQADQVADQLIKIQLFQNLFQAMNNTNCSSPIFPNIQNCANFSSPPHQNPNLIFHDIQSMNVAPCNGIDIDSRDRNDLKPNTQAFVEGEGGDGYDVDLRAIKGTGRSAGIHEGIVNPLPALVSEPSPGTTYDQILDNMSSEPSSTVFEAWDKLMDDDQTNESFWKDILEYVN